MDDFIYRGPQIARVLIIVRAMVDAGMANAVMGNHGFNAIAYHTPKPSGDYYRQHSEKNDKQHHATRRQLFEDQFADAVGWFKTLPVALVLDGMRVVHASWQPKSRLSGGIHD